MGLDLANLGFAQEKLVPQVAVLGGFIVACGRLVGVCGCAVDDVAGVAPVGGCSPVPGVEDSAVEFCPRDGLSSRDWESAPSGLQDVPVVGDQEQSNARRGLVRRRGRGDGWPGSVPCSQVGPADQVVEVRRGDWFVVDLFVPVLVGEDAPVVVALGSRLGTVPAVVGNVSVGVRE